jgi:penicillin-binding protein 2
MHFRLLTLVLFSTACLAQEAVAPAADPVATSPAPSEPALTVPTEAMPKLVVRAAPVDDAEEGLLVSPDPKRGKKNLDASWKTLNEARTVKLTIAGPRGMIVDRRGLPLAQNRTANYLALNFPVISPNTDANVVAFARERINEVNRLLGKNWDVTDEQLIAHYKERRWLPLVFSKEGAISVDLTPDDVDKIKPMLGKGLMLHPTYVRYYPRRTMACHIIGYTGIKQALPTGAISEGEPLIEEPQGRSGLEQSFETDLAGKQGIINILFNPDGSKLSEEVVRRPMPGHNVVTTLDYNMQAFAEEALRNHAKNGGAMVVMDVRHGDVLAMASNPGFDLNDFIPRIGTAKYAALSADPKTPLLGRAHQGSYFPASTFKIVTSLAALEHGEVTRSTFFDCPAGYTIGDRTFHNWAKVDEGSMNVVGAIMRSCNTWFYQAAMQTGAEPIVNMADRLGFGQPTGIPIAESKGFLPSDAFYMQREGHKINSGILASICIGQVVEATPLQVAQSMAAVADGINMPKVRLVKQIQDLNDNVLQVWNPEVRRQLNFPAGIRDEVAKGMIAVVNNERGTGKSAWIEGTKVAGKTGTAQWKDSDDDDKKRWLAWFTGYLPADNPVYAFAVVYEGAFGERVSGGAIAAPIVKEVFSKVLNNAKAGDDILVASQTALKAEPVDDAPEDEPSVKPAKKTEGSDKPATEPPPAEEKKTVGGFLKRLFGNKPD